jgi:ADP-ribosylglycohydrolase
MPGVCEARSYERIVAALKGLATGDAIGKQTETLSREGVFRWYPNGVGGFGTLSQSAESAILLAANVGGDSDSVASIAGAILGARRPDTISLAERLSGLRC